MGSNTAIVTEKARAYVNGLVQNYGAGVFGHTYGDWSSHSVVRIHEEAFQDEVGDTSADTTLRVAVTDPAASNATVAVAIPAVFIEIAGQQGGAPAIIVQPTGGDFSAGDYLELIVGVLSDVSVTYQWQKDSEDISGATSASLIIPELSEDDAGEYQVVVSNSFGSSTSSSVTITVT